MAQFALKAGNLPSYNEANAKAEQQANFDTPVNPIFKNELTAEASIVCYEIRKGSSGPASSATNGVSYSNSSLNFLNRKYPDTTTMADYLENLDTTQGHRIQCYQHTEGEGQALASDFLDTFDMFIVLFADDYRIHHVAKITSVDTEESAGDSFTFSPAYNGEIPRGTKFQIYQGPESSVTDVVAVAYGLQGDGTDDRHDVYTICGRPNFYFYDWQYDAIRSRLKVDGQLDYDTKYKVFYSKRNAGGTEVHDCTCFVTEQQYGLRAIDYSQHQMNATLVDNLRTADTPTAASTPQGYEKYGSTSVAAFNYDFTAWNECFPNIKRSSGNLTKAQSGDFNGPTRYIHYTKSPDKTNVVPRVLENNVFDSVTKTGTFSEARIADPHKIMGKKIRRFDEYRVKETIAEGRIEFAKNRELAGTWASSGSPLINLVASNLEKGDSLDTLLYDGASALYEEILIGDYHYKLSGRGATYTHSDGSLAQNWQISAYRLKTDAIWTVSSTIPVSFSNQVAYRRPWSKITKTLIVDFPQTAVFNDAKDGLLKGGFDVGNLEVGVPNDVYNLEIVLSGGNFTGITLLVNAGEKINSFINFQDGVVAKYQDPTSQMYQKLSLDYPNILDYFQGSYVVNKVTFKGSIENIEEYIEESQHKFYISGRSDVSKLLGPVINKDYKFSEDWIYSTISPVENVLSSGADATAYIEIGQTSISYSGTLSNVEVGTYLYGQGQLNRMYLIGRVSNINTGSSTITLEEGSLSKIGTSDTTPRLYYTTKVSKQLFTFAKAIGTNSKLSAKTTSLMGALDKGLLFNSGKKITSTGADSTKLVDTSSSTNKDAKGYYIHQTDSGSSAGSSGAPNYENTTVSKLLEPFMARLTNGGTSPTYSNFDTVNSIGKYEVVNLSRSEGDTIIELAPVCPAILGRLDYNPADSRALSVTPSENGYEMTTVDDDYAIDYHGVIVCDGIDPILSGVGQSINSTAYGTATEQSDSIGHYVYNSVGQVLGRIVKARWKNGAGASNGYTLSDGSFNHGEILLDRPLPVALADGDKLYVPYKGAHISQGLYLLNTQGLRTGGYIHAMNSSLSSATKPIQYSVAQSATNSAHPWAYGVTDSYNIPLMQYFDLQKGEYGTFTYKKYRMLDGKMVKHSNASNVNAYASVLFPKVSVSYPEFAEHWDYLGYWMDKGSNTRSWKYNKLYNQGMPQSRGIYPAHGSNFEDYRIYSPDALTPGYLKLAQFDHTTGGPWGLTSSSSTNSINGWKDNAISHMRDNLEIIDPNMLRWFIFAPGDIHPESMTRWNHIGFTTRDFTDYSLILKNKSTKESVEIGSYDNTHTNYLGSALSDKEIDADYQQVSMSNASITPDQMKRVGVMRLKELTMDWHFNAIDTETDIDFTEGIDAFPKLSPNTKYTPIRFLTLEKPDFFSDTSVNPTVAATSSYATNGSKVLTLVSNSNFKNGSSGTLIFNAGDRVYAQDGSYIGEVASADANGDEITFVDEPNLVDGKRYCSANDNQNGILYKMRTAGSVAWDDTAGFAGKGGESAWNSVGALGTLPSVIANFQNVYNRKKLVQTQGMVVNGEYPNRKSSPSNYPNDAILNQMSYFGVNPLSQNSAGIQFPPLFGTLRDIDSTVDFGADYVIGASTTITVKTIDATTKFKVGDEIYSSDGFVGVLSAVASTTLTLTAKNAAAITNNDAVYLGYKSMLARTHIFFDELEEQKGISGSRVINSINPDLDDSANLGVAAISMASGHNQSQGIAVPPASSATSEIVHDFTITTGSSGGSGFAATYKLTTAKSEIEFNDAGTHPKDAELTFNYYSTSSTKPYIDIHEIDTSISARRIYTYRCYFDSPSFSKSAFGTTGGSATIGVSSPYYAPLYVGMTVSGSRIPSGATIISVVGTEGGAVSSFDISANVTGSGSVTSVNLTFGKNNPSAPPSGELIAVPITPNDSGTKVAENFNDALRARIRNSDGVQSIKGLKVDIKEGVNNVIEIENMAGGATGSSFVDATCDLTNHDATVTCDASADIKVGMTVACATSGFPTGPTVASINAGTEGENVTSFELSEQFNPDDGADRSNQSLEFYGYDLGHIIPSSLPLGDDVIDSKAPNFGKITHIRHGGNVIDASIKNSGTGYTSAPSIGELLSTYKLNSNASSAVNHIAHMGTRTYSGMKAVVLDRYDVANKLSFEADKGTAVDLGLCYQLEKHKPNVYSQSSFMVATEQNLKGADVIKLPFAERDIAGRKFWNHENLTGKLSIADGINFVLKPILHFDDGDVGNRTAHTYEHKPSGNGTATLRFDVSNGASQGNLWLRYCPNLTGCYLVSSDGYRTSTDGVATANWQDAYDYEGAWTIGAAAHSNKAFSASPEGLYPRAIHYISAHEVVTSGSTQYHDLIVDNWSTSSQSMAFRVMQPAETCFWENTPTSIDMYKMSTKYTKKTNENKLYGDIGHWNIYESEKPAKGLTNRYGMNEGIQSMYVFVDMDPKTGGSGTAISQHLVPRNHAPVVGSGKKFEPDTSYNMYLTDGITKTTKTVTFTNVDDYTCRLNMGDNSILGERERMAGIVSMGEIFTVTTKEEIVLDNIESASVGTSVTVAPEAETIVNDLMKSHSLSFSNSTVSFPYFTGIKVRGADLYNTVNYLASLKGKTLKINPDGFELKRRDDKTMFTEIVISNKSNDVKVLEMKKNQSMYDFFNEVTIYGKEHKATKRDRRSIEKVGKKSLEKVDESLTSQSEVDKEAKRLLMIHAQVNNRITIKTITRGIELLKSGNIVLVDLPDEEIYSTNFMVLEMRYNAFGVVHLELGQYDKTLSDRLAELLMANKRVASILRGDRFRTPKEDMGFINTMKIKAVKLIGRRTHKRGSPFTIGFNYPIDIEPSGGTDDDSGTASYPLGFNESIGSVETTIIVDEDLI